MLAPAGPCAGRPPPSFRLFPVETVRFRFGRCPNGLHRARPRKTGGRDHVRYFSSLARTLVGLRRNPVGPAPALAVIAVSWGDFDPAGRPALPRHSACSAITEQDMCRISSPAPRKPKTALLPWRQTAGQASGNRFKGFPQGPEVSKMQPDAVQNPGHHLNLVRVSGVLEEINPFPGGAGIRPGNLQARFCNGPRSSKMIEFS
jgi:hypothetical protein